jgi:hypothetical protein
MAACRQQHVHYTAAAAPLCCTARGGGGVNMVTAGALCQLSTLSAWHSRDGVTETTADGDVHAALAEAPSHTASMI